MGSIHLDNNMHPVQGFVPRPGLSQANASMTGTVVFKKGATGAEVELGAALALRVNPRSDSYYYYNSDSTKTYPLLADTDSVIMVGDPTTRSVSIVFGTAVTGNSVQGM